MALFLELKWPESEADRWLLISSEVRNVSTFYPANSFTSTPQHALMAYLLTAWSTVILQMLTGSQLVKKFPAFYETWRFIIAFTSARHLSLSWARSIQSMPSSQFLTIHRNIIKLLRLGHPSGLFPSSFTTKTLYAPLFSVIRATCPSFMTYTGTFYFLFGCGITIYHAFNVLHINVNTLYPILVQLILIYWRE